MIQKISVESFISLSKSSPVLDVRSPSEFSHAHFPFACNLPLFTDDERKVVGTLYKQKSKQDAIKAGLDFFGVKMRAMVEEAERLVDEYYLQSSQKGSEEGKNLKRVLVHCWRGGMRSAGVAWLLDLYGFEVYTLEGGYKAFRNWVLNQFGKPYHFKIIGGFTGSGKTEVLKKFARLGHPILDLEAIANHKGSAFGGFDGKQPSQEMFDNLLAMKLSALVTELENFHPIWIEDESQRIGLVNIPTALWSKMKSSEVYFLEVPFEERLNYLTKDYGKYTVELLVNAVIRIQKRLGGVDTKLAVNYILEGNVKEGFRVLLLYYDKFYLKGIQTKELAGAKVVRVPCIKVDDKQNVINILDKLSAIGTEY